MPLQKKLTRLLAVLTILGIVATIAFAPNPGRPAVGVMILGGVCWLVTVRITASRYAAALKKAAASLGLEYLAKPADEKRSALLSQLRLTSESEVFRWKVDGKFPAVAGDFGGFPVAVRVPVGVDFDAGAPDSTRIVVYHTVRMTGFAIYDRTRIKKPPKGRQATLDDPAFDSRFLIVAHRPEEPKAVLGPAVRAALLEAGGVGFRGIEVNRYGVFLHEEGQVTSPELLRRRLELVTTVAAAAKELARPVQAG